MYKRGNGCFAGGKASVFSLDKRDACDYNKKAVSGCSAAGSALGSGPRGREFKSPHSDHIKEAKTDCFGLFLYFLDRFTFFGKRAVHRIGAQFLFFSILSIEKPLQIS